MSEQQPPPIQEREAEPWSARYGLIRPRHGRYIAGVCGALARATKTDPLLWRVLLGVTALFGLGLIVYLAVWLLTPAEGDTASPVEALIGRGHSSTSAVFTIVLSILAIIVIGTVTDNTSLATIAVISFVVIALVMSRNKGQQQAPAAPMAAQAEPAPYQPPFAPHGPYVPPTAPIPPPPPLVKAPKPEPSRLGRLVFGLVLLSLGAIGLADLADLDVPRAAYVAVPLIVVGLGLVIGAWFGRARGFIALGLVLSIMLPMVADSRDWNAGARVWHPTTMAELESTYRHRMGAAQLDLRDLKFDDTVSKVVDVSISFGHVEIIVPSNVDVETVADVRFGEAVVFGDSSDGPSSNHTVTDLGFDNKTGGGKLRINLDVSFGGAEVIRQ